MAFSKTLFFLFHYHLLLLLNLADSKCPKSFECGRLGSFQFPLYRETGCGLFMLDDCDSDSPKIQLEARNRWYEILYKISPNSFFIRDAALQTLLDDKRCYSFENVDLPKFPYSSFKVFPNLTLFTCFNRSDEEERTGDFRDYISESCSPFTLYYHNITSGSPDPGKLEIPPKCVMNQVPMKPNQGQGSSTVFDSLTAEFALEWYVSDACNNCHDGGGQCLTNTMKQFICQKGDRKFKKTFLIGGLLAALASSSIILFLFIRRKYKLQSLICFQKAKTENEKDIELFLKNIGNLALTRYSYSDIKKMTKSFNENLGEGGYGSVYKGKLIDGRLVAVKILNESKGNGEEFLNEVASISKTSHINIVALLGFCSEGSKRALIYEFMPNGSLEKFIQNNASSSAEGGLGWNKLIDIALGIARGLGYLHQGCNTRILHFDIKPHNVLLDKDFNPRISDFGLAKLCPNRSSIVSMLAARGTVGYIAPEVFCRNFGEVSYKSDVYSYGMMVLEIAGGRKTIDPKNVDHSSETYFPHYIYKQLEVDFQGIINEDDSRSARRKLIIVGLWCIQTDPKDRPSMTKVVEMLEGTLESLQVPPKPYLSSPQRSVPRFSSSGSL